MRRWRRIGWDLCTTTSLPSLAGRSAAADMAGQHGGHLATRRRSGQVGAGSHGSIWRFAWPRLGAGVASSPLSPRYQDSPTCWPGCTRGSSWDMALATWHRRASNSPPGFFITMPVYPTSSPSSPDASDSTSYRVARVETSCPVDLGARCERVT